MEGRKEVEAPKEEGGKGGGGVTRCGVLLVAKGGREISLEKERKKKLWARERKEGEEGKNAALRHFLVKEGNLERRKSPRLPLKRGERKGGKG